MPNAERPVDRSLAEFAPGGRQADRHSFLVLPGV